MLTTKLSVKALLVGVIVSSRASVPLQAQAPARALMARQL